jgi:hypothetical protein
VSDCCSSKPCASAGDRASAAQRGRRLEYLTLGWSVTEAAVAIVAGLLAGRVLTEALAGSTSGNGDRLHFDVEMRKY